MKKISCLLLALFVSVIAMAQNNPPTSVLSAFNEREPDVSNPFWEYREEAYVAMFKHEEGLKKVFFNTEGQWLETRTRLAAASAPTGVQEFIMEHYASANVTYIGEVEQPTQTIYRVESELASSVIIKLLTKNGELLKEDKIDWSFMPD